MIPHNLLRHYTGRTMRLMLQTGRAPVRPSYEARLLTNEIVGLFLRGRGACPTVEQFDHMLVELLLAMPQRRRVTAWARIKSWWTLIAGGSRSEGVRQ